MSPSLRFFYFVHVEVEVSNHLTHLLLLSSVHLVLLTSDRLLHYLFRKVPFVGTSSHEVDRKPDIEGVVHCDNSFQRKVAALNPSDSHQNIRTHRQTDPAKVGVYPCSLFDKV